MVWIFGIILEGKLPSHNQNTVKPVLTYCLLWTLPLLYYWHLIKHTCIPIFGFNSNKKIYNYAHDKLILMIYKLKFVLIQTNRNKFTSKLCCSMEDTKVYVKVPEKTRKISKTHTQRLSAISSTIMEFC